MGRWDTIRVVPKQPPAKGWWGFITATPLLVARLKLGSTKTKTLQNSFGAHTMRDTLFRTLLDRFNRTTTD